MRNATLTLLLLGMMLASAPLVVATPTTMTIVDSYDGGNPFHHYPHVDSIGGTDFDFSRMAADFNGIAMKVDTSADNHPGNWSGSSKSGLPWRMNESHLVIEDTKPNSFPEPANMLFFGTGLVGLAGLAGKRKKLPARSAKSAGSPNDDNTGRGNYHIQRQNSQVLAGLPL